MAEKAALEY